MADLGNIGVLGLDAYTGSTLINANIPAVGQLGVQGLEYVTNNGPTISGTITDSLGAPLAAVVHLLSRSTSSTVPATIEAIRYSSDGTYIFSVTGTAPRAILVFDNSSPNINSILIDKVVPG